MTTGNGITLGMNRLYDWLRHPNGFDVTAADAVGGSLTALAGYKYGLLITFRQSGQPVPSPVWTAVEDEARLYVETGAETGNIGRIRSNPLTSR